MVSYFKYLLCVGVVYQIVGELMLFDVVFID